MPKVFWGWLHDIHGHEGRLGGDHACRERARNLEHSFLPKLGDELLICSGDMRLPRSQVADLGDFGGGLGGARVRGLLLMAMSNKFGGMVLTTGNKSEVAVGYATIYGDMAGGYNPIKDLYKMRVFETCRWRSANHRD